MAILCVETYFVELPRMKVQDYASIQTKKTISCNIKECSDRGNLDLYQYGVSLLT